MVQEDGWAPGPVWTGAENFVPTGIQSPERPVRSSVAIPTELPGPLLYTAYMLNSSPIYPLDLIITVFCDIQTAGASLCSLF